MMIEIGSEFSYYSNEHSSGITIPLVIDSEYVFSGRTAIETVLKNIHIKKVLIPSYCCDSMIEPFRKADVEIAFYSVFYDNGFQVNIDQREKADCILICNYFGFNSAVKQAVDNINKSMIVIEDITHSFFSEKQYSDRSDYLVASLRKWMPVLCGGYVGSLRNELKFKPVERPSQDFLSLKKGAMIDKAKYLLGDSSINKDAFLSAFSQSNHWLAQHYSGLTIDEESLSIINSIDMESEIAIRRRNAAVLYNGLKYNKSISFLFDIEDMDCPLFVPVIIKDGQRDIVRSKLTENRIYCPIHWPKPNFENCNSNLYDMELSLICDQRYNEDDMRRIVDVLCN